MPVAHYNRDQYAPVGLFDSGVGGLSIYQHLKKLLPHEKYLYYADTLNVPYGGRKHQQIIELTIHAVNWLYQQGCKLIIIACNSASAYALQIARESFPDISIVGLVPALKPAVFASKTRHIAVLATQATLNSPLFHEVVESVAKPNEVIVSKHFEEKLVPWVEAGMPTPCETAHCLQQILQNFYQNNVDQVVLGCTHYPFFRTFIGNYLEENNLNIQLVDSGEAIALRVKQVLSQDGMENDHSAKQPIPLEFYATQLNAQVEEVIKRLLPNELNISFNQA